MDKDVYYDIPNIKSQYENIEKYIENLFDSDKPGYKNFVFGDIDITKIQNLEPMQNKNFEIIDKNQYKKRIIIIILIIIIFIYFLYL